MQTLILILLLCSILVVSFVVLLIVVNSRRELYTPSSKANNDYNNDVFIPKIQLSDYSLDDLLNNTYVNNMPLIDVFHPVGSLFITLSGYLTNEPTNIKDMSRIFPGTKWELIPESLYMKLTTDDNKVGQIDTTTDIGNQYVSTDYINYTSTPNRYEGSGISSINIFDDANAKTITKTDPRYHTAYIWKRLPNDENRETNKQRQIQINNINLLNTDIIKALIDRIYPVNTIVINMSDNMDNITKHYPGMVWSKLENVFIKTVDKYEFKTDDTGGTNNIDIPDIVPSRYTNYDWPNEKATELQHIITNNKDNTNTDNRPKFINCNIWWRSR